MKQLTIISVLVLTIFSLVSCSEDRIEGSGNLVSEFRGVPTFNKVSSEGVFEVTITQGDTQFVEITADDNIMHKVMTQVVNNELRLFLNEDYNYGNLSLQATIYVESLNGVQNSGVGNITVYDVAGAENFLVNNTGTGNISMTGSAENLVVTNEGTGDFYGFDFAVVNCLIDIEGSGDCEVHCSQSLNVQIEGSGNVYYLGFPVIETDITGSGSVINSN